MSLALPIGEDGGLPAIPDPPSRFAEISELAKGAHPSVGRLRIRRGGHMRYGTGFVVAPGLVMTNRHIAREIFRGRWSRPKKRSNSSGALALPNGVESDVVGVRWVGKSQAIDIALLEVSPSPDVEILPLSTGAPHLPLDGILLGYPLTNRRFDGLSATDRARLAGVRTDELRCHTLTITNKVKADVTVEHTGITFAGNSGSPILGLDTGRVVAVHYRADKGRSFAVLTGPLRHRSGPLGVFPRLP